MQAVVRVALVPFAPARLDPSGAATTKAIRAAAAQAGMYVVFGMAEADAQLPGRLFNSGFLSPRTGPSGSSASRTFR